jgi:hypothetical protein
LATPRSPAEHGRPIPSAVPDKLGPQTVDCRHHLVDERWGHTETGQDGGEMSSDEIEMAIIDRQVLMDLGHPATRVLARSPERHRQERHLMISEAAKIDLVEEASHFGITEHPLVQLPDGDIDAHNAAEALEDCDG